MGLLKFKNESAIKAYFPREYKQFDMVNIAHNYARFAGHKKLY